MVGRNTVDENLQKLHKSMDKKTVPESNLSKDHGQASRVPITLSHFKINDDNKCQVHSLAQFLNPKRFSFQSTFSFNVQSLLRVKISLPDYWQRKSKFVGYSHTYAPSSFQVLARVIEASEYQKKSKSYEFECEIVNIDAIDEVILTEFLF